ncbi:MAG: hypothetical protein KDB27_34265 [Planctomycetales bacterium]|nr:hypothetical protein [Planctomycetales bacterium]
MIAFKDFAPEETVAPGFLRSAEFERFESATLRASDWIEKNNVNVVNIETVVLPSIHEPHEEGSTDPQLRSSGEYSTYWYQIIRVWYRVDRAE